MPSRRVAEKIGIPLEKEINWEKMGTVICVYSIKRMCEGKGTHENNRLLPKTVSVQLLDE